MLVIAHRGDHGAGSGVAFIKTREMPREVGLNLLFRFGQKTEIPLVAHAPGAIAHGQ